MIVKLVASLMKTLNIGSEFSKVPRGRYRSDGTASGERFREDFLRNRLNSLHSGEKLQIVIDDDVEGYGSSFLVEGFAGMVKYGYMQASDLLAKIEIKYTNPDFEFYKKKIEQYIKEAHFNSKQYEPTAG
ncbi:TPA: STAS-like domain-containing protein [Klebsiella aerogenes]|nr:STAS-like domain-containing protein [Klebsiella aerogenes]EIV7213876.1 STAS-like domain-containing protein [Klebsiella aerogenes]EKZ5301202.1 STAS-like domain-containing protein [Klebsiella aerogenes]HDT5494755.1 STAS-like domain-containing protein [Klebsiella aerogenes]